MFQYILPNHLLTGRPQKPQHVQAVHKIWHLLLMGIGKLDFRNDKHLLLIVTNLIEKWLPQFKSVSISILEYADVLIFFIEVTEQASVGQTVPKLPERL